MNDGDAIYFRWASNDVSGTNTRDELAIGNITLTPQVSSGPTLFADPATLAPFTQFVNTPSTEQASAYRPINWPRTYAGCSGPI